MNTAPSVPQPKGGGGGCGKGCTIFLGLMVFLAIALVGGTFWAFHHFRETYSSREPLPMPAVDETTNLESVTESVPAPLPGASAPPIATASDRASAEPRWEAFEKAAKRNEKAQIILSASDINSLLQGDPDLAGKGHVTIQNNIGRVQVSVPLKGVFMMDGRYLNGSASVEASPDGNPGSARIFDVTIAGKKVPDGVLDQQMFGWPSVRTMISDWLNDQDISSFKIENNRVLGETGG